MEKAEKTRNTPVKTQKKPAFLQQILAGMTRLERAVLFLLCAFACKFVFSTAAKFIAPLQKIDLLGSGKPLDIPLLTLSLSAVLGLFCLYRRAQKALAAPLSHFQWAVLGVLILCSAVFYLSEILPRQSLYLWDNATYYNLQVRLESNFADGVFTGVGSTVYKTWFNDYAPLVINLLLEPFYMLGDRTANTFALTCALLIPTLVYYSAALFLAALQKCWQPRAPRLFYGVGMVSMACLPLFHIALYRGMPDLLGVAFALMIMALAVNYDFTAPAPTRLITMAVFTGLLMLTRRCYMFWIFAFFALYAIGVLTRAVRRKNNGAALRFCKFAGVSILCVGLPLIPMFLRISQQNYTERYATYQTGGFGAELANQQLYLGWFATALFLVGIGYGLCTKKTRAAALLALVGAPLTLFLITRVQNMDDHQSLAVLPFYLLGFWLCVYGVSNIRPAWPRRILAALVAGVGVLNFGFCAQFLPMVLPENAYSGLFFHVDAERDDLAQVAAVNDWLRQNCSGENSAYMICHGTTYSSDVFRAAALPDESIRTILAYGACNPGNDAFPKELFFAQAVLTCTPFDPNNHTETINEAFLENQRLYAPFEQAAAFDMGNGSTITAYLRTKPATVSELNTYRHYLAEEDEQFPYNFSAVWDALEPQLAP